MCWGVFLLGCDNLFCPYPYTCEFDDFKRTGTHYCGRGKCPHLESRIREEVEKRNPPEKPRED